MGKRRLFHEDWYFLELGVDSKIEDLWEKENAFKQVNLPHDWQIYHADELYRDGIGWYRKRFFCEKKPGKQYEIYFDGVYMDCTVYLNRQVLGEWKYGYSSFYFDMTDFLCEGENEIVVQVRFLGPNSRWYSGAGIYRNVYLTEYGENHFVTDGVYLTTDEKKDGWQLTVEAELAWNRQPEGGTDTYCVEISVTDLSGTPVAEECCPLYGKETMFDYILKLPQVVPWSLQKPALYLCSLKLMGDDGKKLEDEVCQRIGFRRFSFDTEKGFFLNGVHTKLNGVCEHHDLGALGAAFHRMAMRRKMLILKEMGVNSIRCAHNMPAPELLDLADEMGILIVDEALSVGDVFFQAKCYHKFEEFKKMGKTIIFVSHDLSAVSKYCDKVILLNRGEKLDEGSPKAMVDMYKQLLVNQDPINTDRQEESGEIVAQEIEGSWKSNFQVNPNTLEYGEKIAEIVDFAVFDSKGAITNTIEKGSRFQIKMKILFHEEIQDPIGAYTFKDTRGTEITGTNTMFEKAYIRPPKAGETCVITFEQKMDLQGGEYLISFGCTGYRNGDFHVFHRLYDACNITVVSTKNTVGFYDMNSKVTVEQD